MATARDAALVDVAGDGRRHRDSLRARNSAPGDQCVVGLALPATSAKPAPAIMPVRRWIAPWPGFTLRHRCRGAAMKLPSHCLGIVACLLPALLSPTLATAQSRPLGLAWQLTYSYNMDNALSPDGKRMVFIRVIEGREQLFAMNTDGSGEVQLTRDAADHEDPAW
jgi:hypothetical protein